jgi:hypothetical protein
MRRLSRTQRPCGPPSLVGAIIANFLITFKARAAWEIEPRASPSPRRADRIPRLTSPYCSSTRVYTAKVQLQLPVHVPAIASA